jgi:histone deacetylase complex regulatory component SIN3
LFPSEESTFDSDTLSDDAKWQYYIASYEMSDHTEGVDYSQLRYPFLRRRLPQAKGLIEDMYSAVFGTLHNEDTQMVSISPDTYKMYLEGSFDFHRDGGVREKKKQENEQLEDRLVKQPAWLREESEEAVNRRMAAWARALKEDLSGYEASLTKAGTEFGPAGDVAMPEATA